MLNNVCVFLSFAYLQNTRLTTHLLLLHMMTLVWCSNRGKEVPAIYSGSSAMKLERWLTMSRQQAGLQIRLWRQWGATFRWAEPQSRSLSRGDTQQFSTKATTVKRKTYTRGEQRTERALYWHTAEAADTIWHPAQWRGKSTQWTVTCSLCWWSFSSRENKRWLVMQTTPFGVSTRAGCQRADWDSRQLSPSSGGGSDIKCCFQSCGAGPRSP